MNGEIAIRAANLRKVYRLYAKPSYRFRDMFGMLGDKPGAYTEHAALDGVNIAIRRGEKVAIIGRNGAGKSTLLKLVTNVIQPTSGALEVKGNVHALLQIGTGFHPDFTGRENVYAYLAQLGVTGDEAGRRCAEVIEFSELEEYIDQPVKTYSTGMTVRLMFSASTAITPDLLVLDEVLGVGDAYFAHKSYQRIRDLCDRDGTTLLLVTHDIYSAVKLCERVVWIDRGRVLMDGGAALVVKAYEDSVRQQEEVRLRVKTQERLERQHGRQLADGPLTHLLIEIRASRRIPPRSPVYFSLIELRAGTETIASLPLDADAFNEERASHLISEGTSWGAVETQLGRQARPFMNYGSAFHKVSGVFAISHLSQPWSPRNVSVHLTYCSESPCELTVHVFADRKEWSLGPLLASAREWISYESALADALETAAGETPAMQGTGRILVDDVTVFDDRGQETHFLEHGKEAMVALRYRIVDPDIAERAQVIVAFHRDGVQTACRMIAKDLMFNGKRGMCGTVTLRMPRVILGSGEYSVTVMVVAEGYYDQPQTIFYSINPSVYCCLNRVSEITVTGGGLIAAGTAFVGEGVWSLTPLPDEVSAASTGN